MMLPPRARYSEGPVDPTAREAWAQAAERYLAHCAREANWNKLIEIPAMRRLLGDVRGKRTLEVGCGPAHYSIWLAQQGAEAWGLDPAAPLIEEARQQAEAAGVELRLRLGGVELLPEYPEGHFDIVLFPMMLEYVDDIDGAFREAHRLLKPDGFVALSIVHPMRNMSVKYETEDGEELRIISGYLQRGVIEWSGWIMVDEDGGDIPCKSHRRTIEDYVEALAGAGFLIEAMREPDASPEGWAINARDCRENQHCPNFLLMKAVKRGRP
jgi:ubiquinone/menaquinone biosynthesis C-methylase UbiE